MRLSSNLNAYVVEARCRRKQELMFKQSSLYVCQQKLVPEIGDWRTLPQEDGWRVLVRNAQGVELMSNVCRHRQALMLGGQAGNVTGPAPGQGNLKETGGNIVCPLHRWTDRKSTRLNSSH